MSCTGGCSGVLKGGCCTCSKSTKGDQGDAGATGLSAYDIWINEGNVGTEQDFLDSLNGTDGNDGVCVCEEVLSAELRLGTGTGGISPAYALVVGTQYTVPALGDGDYRISFTSEVKMAVGGGSVGYQVYVNGLAYGTTIRTAICPTNGTYGTSLIISNIALVATDTIDIWATSDDPVNTYLNYGTCVIEKLS